MENVLVTHGLSKRYRNLQAVKNLGLKVPKGSVYGILGPNGSGKTTTLGMVLGITKPSSGSFEWFEGDTSLPRKQRMGALLETPNFYPYLSARKNLELVATVKELHKPDIEGVLKTVNLHERKNDKFKTYSLGMKQRLAIASALLCDPEFLVLDEPTNGLDPSGIAEVRDIINGIANQGITVLMASHILVEVEKLCTHVAVLRKGELLYDGPVEGLSQHQGLVELNATDTEALETALAAYPHTEKTFREGAFTMLLLKEEVEMDELNRYLCEKGVYLSHLNLRKESLEQKFLNLVNQQ